MSQGTLAGIERTIPKKGWMEEYEFILIETIEDLEVLIDRAIKKGLCAFDLESTGLDTRVFNGVCNCQVVGYSIAFEPKKCYYIPIRHAVETDRGKNLDVKKTNALIQKLINECEIVGHNWLKFDIEMMSASEGISLKKIAPGTKYPYHDTYVLARLAGMNPAGLKHLSKKLLDKEMIAITEIVNSKKEIDFGSVSPYEGCLYAASDAICTLELFLHPEIQKPIKEQAFIYTIERKLLPVVLTMERNKIKLDVEHCKMLDKELIDKIEEIETDIYRLVSEKTEGKITHFKIDSPADVSNILFNVYDMNPKPEQGKNGNYKTDDASLQALSDEYPLAKRLQEYRTSTKFHRTYIKNMLINVDKTGYLKFNFSALRTDSGRFASPGKSNAGTTKDGCSGVNIQAVPARYDKSKPNVRKCISCESDELIVAMDWAGVEIRVAANMSLEPIWLDRFLKGDGDLHTSTASIIHDILEKEVTKPQRQIGKTFNFQSIYGGGPGALASTLGLTIDDAKEKQKRFFGRLLKLNQWIKSLQFTARKKGYCLTQFGRKRMLPEFESEIPRIQSNAKRKAVNTPVQGSAADLMKIAMILIDKYLEDNNLRDHVQMLLTMHDELVFRIKKTHVDIIPEIEKVMRLDDTVRKINWKVPLAVDVEIGPSWDIHYEYPNMLEYLKETHNQNRVAFMYESGQDYETHLEACKQFHKAKKNKKNKEEEDRSNNTTSDAVLKENFKKDALAVVIKAEEIKTDDLVSAAPPAPKKEAVVEKPLEIDESPLVSESAEEVASLEEATATASDLDKYFHVIQSASLGDLPEEAHQKLKRFFYEKEIERIMEGTPSKEDEGIEIPLIVHAPIDSAKKNLMGYIMDSCPGNGRVKFLTEKKEELHKEWISVDVLKASIMCKIFNL